MPETLFDFSQSTPRDVTVSRSHSDRTRRDDKFMVVDIREGISDENVDQFKVSTWSIV